MYTVFFDLIKTDNGSCWMKMQSTVLCSWRIIQIIFTNKAECLRMAYSHPSACLEKWLSQPLTINLPLLVQKWGGGKMAFFVSLLDLMKYAYTAKTSRILRFDSTADFFTVTLRLHPSSLLFNTWTLPSTLGAFTYFELYCLYIFLLVIIIPAPHSPLFNSPIHTMT